jgi:hypothetical protein
MPDRARPVSPGQDRHALAGVVGARPGRIVAVIGGEDREVAGSQTRQEVARLGVEGLERARIAGHVARMAVIAVELDEVAKGQGTRLSLARQPAKMFQKVVVRSALVHRADAAMGEDVVDLAHRMHHPPRGRGPVHQRGLGRRDGVVAPVAGPGETRFGAAQERPRDRPSDAAGVQEGREPFAERVEPVEPERLFMRGDLDDAVGRGVADGPAGAQVLGAEVVHDGEAGGVAIAQDTPGSGQSADLRHQSVVEGGLGLRKVGPVPRHRNAGQFPVPRGRVLAARHFSRRAPQALWLGPQPRRPEARGKLDRPAQPQPVEDRHSQRPRAPDIRTPRGAGLGDVTQRVGALVAEIGRIRRAAAADRIEHDQEGAVHATRS